MMQPIQPTGKHAPLSVETFRRNVSTGDNSYSLSLLALIGLSLGASLGLGFLPPPLMPQVWAQSSQPAAVSQGYALLKKGWVNDAIQSFRAALQQAPNSLEAKVGLAMALQKAGQDANAWTAYQQVLQQDPQNRVALAAVGLLGGYRPEWQAQGISALTRLLALEPTHPTARSQRALLLGYQGRFLEALSEYEQLLAANPNTTVLLEAAQVYSYSGNYPQSLELFQRYLRSRSPGSSAGSSIPDNALSAYSATLRGTGQPQAAVDILSNRLAAASGRSLPAYLTIDWRSALAVAYAATGQTDMALQTLAPLRNNPSATVSLARSLSQIGQLTANPSLQQEAISLYRQAVQQTPSPSPGLRSELAEALSQQPETRAEALQQLTALLAEQPNDSALGLRVAQLRLQLGDLAGAKQALETVTSNPATTEQAIAADLLLADIDRRQANWEASAERYQAIIRRNPNPTTLKNALRSLAGVRRAQGRTAEAQQAYTAILELDPQDGAAQLGRANLAYRAQQLSEAEAQQVLNQWQPTASLPPAELFALVGSLPPSPQRADWYDRLLQLDPTNLAIQKRQIQLLALSDRPAAQARIGQLQRQATDLPTRLAVADLARSTGDLALAAEVYSDILQAQPTNTEALAALGGIRFEQKNYPAAEALYGQVLALNPQDWDVQRILAELSLAQDQPFTALDRLQAAQQLQAAQGIPDADLALADRIVKLRVDRLKRRGFQPEWERY
jgi:cellulose synthase operon protein C